MHCELTAPGTTAGRHCREVSWQTRASATSVDGRGNRFGLLESGKKEVWTLLSTLLASDWAVYRPDWLGLPMFPRESSVYMGWNAVRVPPRAQHFPSSEGFLL